MPELPEVETVRRGLAAAIVGARVESVAVAWPTTVGGAPRDFIQSLTDATFAAVGRRGKYLLLHLHDGRVLIVHLRMTGQFLLGPPDKAVDKHTQVALSLSGVRTGGKRRRRASLHFRDQRKFGRMQIVAADTLQNVAGLRELGPEAPEISAADFRLLLRHRDRQIKALLLDQRRIAGLGNIYVDEMLWAAKVHPARRCASLSARRAADLHRHMVRLLQAAIDSGGTTRYNFLNTNGQAGAFAGRLQVYGRGGQGCYRCGHAIRRVVVAGRGTHICPTCQPIPRSRR